MNNELPVATATPTVPTAENLGGSNTAHADMSIHSLDAYNQHLVGKILTTVDAVMPYSDQSQATKKLIKQMIWEARDHDFLLSFRLDFK